MKILSFQPGTNIKLFNTTFNFGGIVFDIQCVFSIGCTSQFGLARLQVFTALWLPAHNTTGELWRPANHSGPTSEWTKEPSARPSRQRSCPGEPRAEQSMASRGRGRSAAARFLTFLLNPFWSLVGGSFAKTLVASSPKTNTQTFGGGLRPLHSPSKS